jgi:hypothetical protein
VELVSYFVIMLDEVHEWTTHTNVLFGLLKGLVKWRHDLRLIVIFHNNKCGKNCWLFVSSLITPSSPSLDKRSQRRFSIEITKQPKNDYFNVALITTM